MDRRIRYIDLFCGLGAFHEAFKTHPAFECVFASDINVGIQQIYRANYNINVHGDLCAVDVATIPEFDLLCAGFPCQPFSIAGNGEGFKDVEKGNLFYELLRILDARQPTMCILENVKNLKTHDNGNTYNTIESELKKRGYNVTSEILNAAKFGSPQARQRIFIVATHNRPFSIPSGTERRSTVSSILDTFVSMDTIRRDKYEIKNVAAAATAAATTATATTATAAAAAAAAAATTAATAATIPSDTTKPKLVANIFDKKTKKGGRQGERIYDPSHVGITVCASSGGPGAKTGLYRIGDTIRRLTVKETLGMFGFPSTYTFCDVSSEHALFYLGNSIVVDVIKAFVDPIVEWFHHHHQE